MELHHHKICRECGIDQPIENFYVHNRMGDGHLNKCKACVKSRVKVHYQDNIESIREYDRKRASLPHRVKARYDYSKTEKGRESRKKTLNKAKELYPTKAFARYTTSNAIRDGKLIRQPCIICGGKAEAHHPDYSKPLEVIWLCNFHHRMEHKKEKALNMGDHVV